MTGLKTIKENQPVKILAGKLPFVPPRFDYKVIFMDRTITDRLLSLKKTKAATNKKAAVNDTISLAAYAKNEIQTKRIEKWLARQQQAKNVELCRVGYNTLLENHLLSVIHSNENNSKCETVSHILDATNKKSPLIFTKK